MSAAIATAVKKIAVYILSNAKARKGALVAVGSIIAGFLGLMFFPIAVLSGIGEVDVEENLGQAIITPDAFMQSLTPEQQQDIHTFQNNGTAIENAMAEKGVQVQTVNAQLIFVSFFDDADTSSETFYSDYANLFANSYSDEVLIQAINTNYGLNIDYDEYMKTYTMKMNLSINKYMFTDSSYKSSDLSAWAENAYISGWGFGSGCIGEIDTELKYRTCDNAGLILGYLIYSPSEKNFSTSYLTVNYTIEGTIDERPETVGIGLYDGSIFGVYIGNGECIYASEDIGFVTKELVSEHSWTEWCTFSDVIYPEVDNGSNSEEGADENEEETDDGNGMKVENLRTSTISVSCIKVQWDAEEGRDYEISCVPKNSYTGYASNIYYEFKSKELCYITGLRENSAYRISVTPIRKENEDIAVSPVTKTQKTESVEVIEEFPHEEGWTNSFAYENAKGLTADPSWSAIQNCSVDKVTNTGIMRDQYGDYCCAMGTVYGYCGDRFLVELNNGVQFTTKICDSKGDIPYHDFGGSGKCIVEFIHGDGALPSCVFFSGNYGNCSWSGLYFDNIKSIKKINYNEPIEY